MDERARGLMVALILVTVGALGVSFFASTRAKGVRRRLQKLTQTNRSLQTELTQAQQKYSREAASVQELQEALAQEQARNQAPAKQPGPRRTSPDAQEQQAVKTNFQTR